MSDNNESFTEMSRRNFFGNRTIENIKLGCFQRIADATEKMAVNHDRLMHDRDMYKRMYETARESILSQERSARSLKGQITKLHKQIAQLRAPKDEP